MAETTTRVKKTLNTSDVIVGKIVIQLTLENISPLIIASGNTEHSDKDIIIQHAGDEEIPYIPGSSLAGVLRDGFNNQQSQIQSSDITYHQLWGSPPDSGTFYQSHIIIEDAMGPKGHEVLRKDGTKIDINKRVVDNKYDYQTLAVGAQFLFHAEITIRAHFDDQLFKDAGYFIIALLQNDLRLGAKTQSGFGRMRASAPKLQFFDFPKDANKWFHYLDYPDSITPYISKEETHHLAPISKYHATITATFKLRSPLIVSEHGRDVNDADKIQMKRGDGYLIPGPSLKGVIRHRAHQILHTVLEEGDPSIQNIFRYLFGHVDENEQNKGIKSSLKVEEAIIPRESVVQKKQTRIKIDRFTGGTMSGALMETAPIHHKDGDNYVKLTMTIQKMKAVNGEDQTMIKDSITLVLHILRDLWTGDLTIGGEKGIGRGRLTGHSAMLTIGPDRIDIIEQDGLLQINDPGNILNKYNHFSWQN